MANKFRLQTNEIYLSANKQGYIQHGINNLKLSLPTNSGSEDPLEHTSKYQYAFKSSE